MLFFIIPNIWTHRVAWTSKQRPFSCRVGAEWPLELLRHVLLMLIALGDIEGTWNIYADSEKIQHSNKQGLLVLVFF